MDDSAWRDNPESKDGWDAIAKYYKGAKSNYDIKKEFMLAQERILKAGGYL